MRNYLFLFLSVIFLLVFSSFDEIASTSKPRYRLNHIYDARLSPFVNSSKPLVELDFEGDSILKMTCIPEIERLQLNYKKVIYFDIKKRSGNKLTLNYAAKNEFQPLAELNCFYLYFSDYRMIITKKRISVFQLSPNRKPLKMSDFERIWD